MSSVLFEECIIAPSMNPEDNLSLLFTDFEKAEVLINSYQFLW